MQLLRHDEETRSWSPGELDPGICLVPMGRSMVMVCGPTARLFSGGRPTSPVVLVEDHFEFCVDRARFRLIVHPPLEELCFAAGADSVSCARCKKTLASGDRVVRCRCGARLHEGPTANGGEPLLCLSYAPSCPCGVPRAELEGAPGEDGDA